MRDVKQTVVNGRKGYRWEWERVDRGKGFDAVFAGGGRGYYLYLATAPENYARYKPIFEDIVLDTFFVNASD